MNGEQKRERLTAEDITESERTTIQLGRSASDGGKATEGGANYFGLALSGGGIRSATFNLGILQALAEHRLLSRVDYLSTVSGGGYIGAWLSALIHRGAERLQPPRSAEGKSPAADEIPALSAAAAVRQIECECHMHPSNCPCDGDVQHLAMVGEGESATVSFLRRYSNYLTPRSTFFSLDALGALANLLRNLLLNQSILICLLVVSLLLPRIMAPVFEPAITPGFDGYAIAAAALAAALLGLTAQGIARGLRTADRAPAPDDGAGPRRHGLSRTQVAFNVVLPSFAASLTIAWLLSTHAGAVPGAVLIAGGTVIYLAAWLLGWFIACCLTRDSRRNKKDSGGARWASFILSPLIAGAATGAMLYGYANFLLELPHPIGWFSIGLGTVIVWEILCLAVMLHIGLAKRLFSEIGREWLGRAGGLVFSVQLAWAALCLIALYGPPLVAYLSDWVAYAGLAWIAHTVAGVLLARGDKTKEVNWSGWREVVAQSMPYVFIAGMLLLLSAALHNALTHDVPVSVACMPSAIAHQGEPPPRARVRLELSAQPPFPLVDEPLDAPRALSGQLSWLEEKPGAWKFLAHIEKAHTESQLVTFVRIITALVAFAAAGVILAWRVDVNLFSMHQFYRNRLTRCYLGASRKRNPDRFTDFDPDDDLPLHRLKHQRPVHLINGALNLTRLSESPAAEGQPDRRDWQERLSASFVFSPHGCGYQLARKPGVFRPTEHYMERISCFEPPEKGVHLGLAMAVSGAAASPNMGYHSSPALAFVMTFFNVRLGRWCANPALDGKWRWSSPWFGLKYLLAELLGAADDTQPFVNVSDGGHFENLGLYELVRRRCRLIVVCDASRDGKHEFEDLGNAVHKCRVDLGAEIDIDVKAIKWRKQRCAVGRIAYADGTCGVLVYVKPVVRGDEPVDVAHYAATHKDFPHQSTSDQWFDESQFESYRQLGLLTGREIFGRHQWTTANETCNEWVKRTADLLERGLPTKIEGDAA